jgi:putative peptidoglycan lipid II flippase
MPFNFFKKSISWLVKQQTNILSAAFVLMATAILSQLLGLLRQRLLVANFGASDTLGVYLASSKLPDFFFQLIIAGALATAFIPVFSSFLAKGKKEEANKMASTTLSIGILTFGFISIILFIFAPFFLRFLNLGSGYTPEQMILMAKLMRVIIVGQMIFLIAAFFAAILQSYQRFIVVGIAAALYNLGIIIGILLLTDRIGIYAPAVGVILGASLFALFQIPLLLKLGFSFSLNLSLDVPGVKEVLKLMGPRALSILVFQVGTLITLALISFLPSAGRSFVIYDYALTLSFAPVVLFGQSIAQAALPVLSREKDMLDKFRSTFTSSYIQMLYLVLPVSVLFLVLRIPIVRLIFGAAAFDWMATVLTGRTLAFFALSIFASALIYLVTRAFFALQDTKTPLILGTISTIIMITLSSIFVLVWSNNLMDYAQNYTGRFRLIPVGVESLAFAYSIAAIINLSLLLFFLNRKVGIFSYEFFISQIKIFLSVVCMGFALYIPIKLLDQLVFDTTRTINLILLTGISSFFGFAIYFFLTWLLNVKEASTFLLMFKKMSGRREIIGESEKILDPKISQ